MKKVDKIGVSSEILNYIKANAGTTFVEIERIFEQNGFDYKGDLSLMSECHENLLFWTGWNKQATDILNELIHNELIVRKPSQVLNYYIDGKVLDMPIAQHYKKRVHEAWFPIAFSFNRKETARR